MTNDDLKSKVRLLETSHFFSPDYGGASPAEKQTILLVLCGKKPLAEVTSGHWVFEGNTRHSVPEDHGSLGKFLASLGLSYSLTSDEYATNAIISFDQEHIYQYIHARDAATVGGLLGYPKTATEAFVKEKLLSSEEQELLMQEKGLPEFMPQFRLSRQNAQNEIRVLEDWYMILRQFNFLNQSTHEK